ncbi:MAG: NAD(P)/FAD-dependent oxidoreductase, partial [Pirellulaceae bacterium]
MHDLIVVGGGVIGLSIAWEAASRGLRVVVLEAGRTGRASSWAGAGMLPTPQRIGVEDPLELLRLRSHLLHASWAERLQEVTGIDTQYRRCGAVAIGRTAGEFATLAANEAWWDRHGMEYQRLGPEELKARLPRLRPEPAIRGGWFFPDDCQLRNPCHLQALREAGIRSGVVIEEDSPALSWKRQHDRLIAVETSRGIYEAAAFCVAAGAWSRDVGLPETRPLGILPIRGQMILYRFPAAPFHSIIQEGHLYLVPRADGRLLAGSCEEEAGFDARTTPERIEQ